LANETYDKVKFLINEEFVLLKPSELAPHLATEKDKELYFMRRLKRFTEPFEALAVISEREMLANSIEQLKVLTATRIEQALGELWDNKNKDLKQNG